MELKKNKLRLNLNSVKDSWIESGTTHPNPEMFPQIKSIENFFKLKTLWDNKNSNLISIPNDLK